MANLALLLTLVAQAAAQRWPCNVEHADASSGAVPTTFEFGGYNRTYFKYVPESISADTPNPLVLELHGFTFCAAMMDYTDFRQKADIYGFVLIWPQGLFGDQLEGYRDQNPCWNAGDCCGSCPATDVDDVAFLREVVSRESAAYNIHAPVDPQRVYFTGHSNGCMMAQRMNADASDIVAAVACFAGDLVDEPESWYEPRSVMVIWGTWDRQVTYRELTLYGGYGGAEENLADWATHHGCPDQEPEVERMDGYILHEVWCGGVVAALAEIPRAGHFPVFKEWWPWPFFFASVDTTQLAWDFVSQFTLPTR